jgi:hypothetical protein
MGLFVLRDKRCACRKNAVRCRKYEETKPGVGRAEATKAPIRGTARGKVGGMREPRKQERVTADGQVKRLTRQKAVGLDEASRSGGPGRRLTEACESGRRERGDGRAKDD